ncbi:hypothetical protein FHX44_112804 [Pseudonocardia hierapolitana]|uniref:Uncharacterized protein n=1 Tax=Pseudonocardia hierapolitana TaxID=1128676 RepID=A0A561SPY4_9PSEU|nr:hypothetical protein [Pseudonocardia hierapolitana]TWF76906.1 hypothetical protein FHX44_112804 [Pseudonocardia hierapolitana]
MNSPAAVLLDFAVRHRGQVVARFSAAADPLSAGDLRQLLVDAIRRRGTDDADITDYEMEMRPAGEDVLITTFVATRSSNQS